MPDKNCEKCGRNAKAPKFFVENGVTYVKPAGHKNLRPRPLMVKPKPQSSPSPS